MSSLHWMQLYVADMRNSNTYRAMTKLERGCYLDLLLAAWTNANSSADSIANSTPMSIAVWSAMCSIPAKRETLYRITDCFTQEERDATDSVLAVAFHPCPSNADRLYNKRQTAVWLDAVKQYRKRVEGGKKRWNKSESNRPDRRVHSSSTAGRSA